MYGDDDDDGRSGLDNIHDTLSTVTVHGHGVRLPEGMTEERALSVYDNYTLQHRYNVNLPITRYRQDVSPLSVTVCLSVSVCMSVSVCLYLHVCLCLSVCVDSRHGGELSGDSDTGRDRLW